MVNLNQFLVALAVCVSVVYGTLASVVKTGNPIDLTHRLANPRITSKLSLDCRKTSETFEIVVATDDAAPSHSINSYISLLGANGQSGSGQSYPASAGADLVLTAPLTDPSLTFVPSQKNCDATGLANCGAVLSGRVAVKLYFEVEGTGGKLFWPAFHHVDFSCRLEPRDPVGKELTTIAIFGSLEVCEDFHHSATLSWSNGKYSVVFDLKTGNTKYLMLYNCDIRQASQSAVPFMRNGLLLTIPRARVSGRAFGELGQYRVDFDQVNPLNEGGFSATDKIECQVTTCRLADGPAEGGAPFCPTGEMPHVPGSPTVFKAWRQMEPLKSFTAQLYDATLSNFVCRS